MRILVVGGGIIGLASAWRLVRRGCTVELLDAAPEARSASWAAGGMLAPHHEALNHGELLDEPLWRLGCASLEAWRGLAAELGGSAAIDHREDGGTVPELAGDRTVRADRLLAAGVMARRLDAAALRDLEPALGPGVTGGWWLPGGQVDPRRAVERLRAACLAAGVGLRSGDAVVIGAQQAVLRDGTHLAADRVVLACGAWTPALAAASGIDLPGSPVKGQMVRFAAADGLLTRFAHSHRAYLIPRAGQGVVVGATMVEAGFDRSDDPAAIARLAEGAAALVPGLAGAPVAETWTGLRPRLDRGRPVIAALADGPVLATGHFRNGILLAPATAHLVEHLVLGGEPPWDLRPFALPTRVAWPAAGVSSAPRTMAEILIVEDNPVNQKLIAFLLARSGYSFEVAENGAAALKRLEQGTYRLVLMDMMMPVMNGYEAVRALRADPRHRDLPVIALTANAMKGEDDKCRAAGCNDYIAKPYTKEQILAAIRRQIGAPVAG